MNCFAAEIAIKIGKKLNAADENISNNMNHQVSVKCPKPTLSTIPKIPINKPAATIAGIIGTKMFDSIRQKRWNGFNFSIAASLTSAVLIS